MLTLGLALVVGFEGRFLFDHFLFRRRGIEVAFILIINDGKLWEFTVCLTMRNFQMLQSEIQQNFRSSLCLLNSDSKKKCRILLLVVTKL